MITVTEQGHGLGWKPQLADYRDYLYERQVKVAAPEDLPDTVDLTPLIPWVWNQLQLGSCVAHGTLEAFAAWQVKMGMTPFPGCRLLTYRDARIIGGDYPGDNGCQIRDGIQATIKDGVCNESLWAYDITKFDDTPPAAAVTAALGDETVNYFLLDSQQGGAQSLNNIMDCMANKGLPVVYGTTLWPQFENVDATGIIEDPSGNEIGGHCMLFVGYDPQYLWTLNSWGSKAFSDGGWGKPFTGAGGVKFDGGLGLLPKDYVLKGYASDFEVIAGESLIPAPTPTPTPTPIPPTPTPTPVMQPKLTVRDNPAEVIIQGELLLSQKAVSNAPVVLQVSPDRASWASLTSIVTDKNGAYKFAVGRSGKNFLRVTFAGTNALKATTSRIVEINFA